MSSRITQRFPQAQDDKDDTRDAAGNSITSPAVPMPVVYKLLAFTLAMITLPIGTYFATVNFVFGGNSTWAGALAAVVANVVLVAYVVVAMNEDLGEPGGGAVGKGGKSE